MEAQRVASTSRSAGQEGASEGASEGANAAVVLGQLVAEPELRELPSGSEIASFSLTVRRTGAKTTSVPVSWVDPPAGVRSWQAGEMVVCRGQVVRRFFRGGAGLGSATEVVVVQAALARHPRRARKVVMAGAQAINDVLADVPT